MKKITEEKVVDATEHPRNAVRNYYTPEVIARVHEMTDKQMENLMKDFMASEYWIALIKYNTARISLLDTILRFANPYVDTYEIAKTQGRMEGLSDVETYVIALNSPKE